MDTVGGGRGGARSSLQRVVPFVTYTPVTATAIGPASQGVVEWLEEVFIKGRVATKADGYHDIVLLCWLFLREASKSAPSNNNATPNTTKTPVAVRSATILSLVLRLACPRNRPHDIVPGPFVSLLRDIVVGVVLRLLASSLLLRSPSSADNVAMSISCCSSYKACSIRLLAICRTLIQQANNINATQHDNTIGTTRDGPWVASTVLEVVGMADMEIGA